MFEQIKKVLLKNEKNRKLAITIGWVSLVLIVLIIAANMGGSSAVNADELSASTEFNIGEMVFGTMIRLVLVLALIYGLFSIYRLFQKSDLKIAKRRLQIVDLHRFSQKQAVVILRVDDQELLIGLTDHEITFLKTISAGNQKTELQDFNDDPDRKPFQDYMDEQNEQ
jgi:flagellar biogenesis protein FliO